MLLKYINRLLSRKGLEITNLPRPFNEKLAYKQFSEKSLVNKKFLNIGSGSFFTHKYWSRLDFVDTEYYSKKYGKEASVEFNFDLSKKDCLPIKSDTFELAYTSHTIEHLEYDMVEKLFFEVYRILKPGGGFRITCPNIELHYIALQNTDRHFYYWLPEQDRSSIAQHFLQNFAAPLAELNPDIKTKVDDNEIIQRFSKEGMKAFESFSSQCKFNPNSVANHISWWSRDRVCQLLNESGFAEVFVSGYGQSIFPPLRDTKYFDNTQVSHSLYIEAKK